MTKFDSFKPNDIALLRVGTTNYVCVVQETPDQFPKGIEKVAVYLPGSKTFAKNLAYSVKNLTYVGSLDDLGASIL